MIGKTSHYATWNGIQRIGVERQNKQPTTDLYDRMVILSTSFGHNNDLFQDTELKRIFTEVLKNGSKLSRDSSKFSKLKRK